MRTESAFVDDLKEVFSAAKYSNVIDILRSNSVFVLDVTPETITDIFLEAGADFTKYVRQAIYKVAGQKRSSDFDPELFFRNLRIELIGVNAIEMHDISAREHERKTVTFDCIVIAADTPKSYVKKGKLVCQLCGHSEDVECDSNRDLPSMKCSTRSCLKNTLKVDSENLITDDIQTILMQETMEKSKNHSPVILTGKLTGCNVGTVFVGQKKRITGIFRSVIVPKKAENEIVIEVATTEDLEETELIKPDEVTLSKLKNFAEKSPKEYKEAVIKSFSPHIYGNKDVKESIILSLLGGVSTKKKRGDIHILMVGDPSMAKSELLKSARGVTQKSIYTSGKGSSAAGLTIGMVKLSDGRMVAQAGVLPLCSGGFAFIDEFDKMNKDDRSGLHEAMEQQTVSIAKAGTKMTLPAQTTILAAANPRAGKYDLEQSLGDNLDVPSPLLSRFDIIWLFIDEIHRDDDREKAKHIIDSFTKQDDTEYNSYLSETELMSVLNYGRDIEPVLTDDVIKSILKLYEKMRELCKETANEKLPVGTRQLEAIIRMSMAHAKLFFRSNVINSDLEAVESLLTKSLDSFGLDLSKGNFNQAFLDGIRTKDTKEQTALSVWYKVADEFGNVKVDKFLKELSEAPKFSQDTANRLFTDWERELIVKRNPDGSYRKT